MLRLDSHQGQLLGPEGALPLSAHDEVSRKLAMLIAGECLGLGPTEAARAFGYTKQRYFQLRTAFARQGASALVDNTPGPGRHYRCTEEAVRQAIRHRFLDPDGYPAVKPPWGQLTAIDLGKGEIVWQSLLGEHEELTAKGIPRTGTENLGGSIVTKGGLVFIAATKDEKFRAFDVDTGKVAWETKLPAGGYATPSTYEVGGRQHVVIACGGAGKGATKSGDEFVAFALEDA